MNELEKIYRWRKKKGTGSHYFSYNGEKNRVVPGKVVDCPVRFVNPCIDQYECLGLIGEGGELIKVDVEKILDESFDFEDDIKLKVIDLGDGLFDVINPANPDKPINEKALSLEDANKLAGVDGGMEIVDVVDLDDELRQGKFAGNDNHVEDADIDNEEKPSFQVVPTGRGWFDVIDPRYPDKPINEKSLRLDEANKLAGIEVAKEGNE